MPKPSPLSTLAQDMGNELRKDTEAVASSLSLELTAGATGMSTPDFLQHVRDHWNDVNFRQQLAQRIGPKAFVATANEAFGVPKEMRDPLLVTMGTLPMGGSSNGQ